MKQQQLTFEKGITNTPSDMICSDNTLRQSLNMSYHEGEFHPIQRPKILFSTGNDKLTIIYVHRYNDMVRYVCVNEQKDNTGGTYYAPYWFTQKDKSISDMHILNKPNDVPFYFRKMPKITSVGKTLIITSTDGIYYFLWRDDYYKSLGNKLPEIDIEFSMSNDDMGIVNKVTFGRTDSVRYNDQAGEVEINENKKTAYNDFIIGLYAKNKKDINHIKAFSRPFFVRAAYRMYDDSYYMATQPVMMFPSITENSYLSHSNITNDPLIPFAMYTAYSRLFFRLNSFAPNFSDIIKDVSIFVTDEIEIYDLFSDAVLDKIEENRGYCNSIMKVDGVNQFSVFYPLDRPAYRTMKTRSVKDIVSDITSSSVFYHLCDIGTNNTDKFFSTADFIKTNVLENITTQTQLTGDFYDRAPLFPQILFSYNSRINIAGVSRGFFDGFDNFLPYDNDNEHTYIFYVTIKTDNGNVVVSHEKHTKQKQGIWFYYPDPRASHVVIKKDDDFILSEDLTEHPGLNGAYYFRGLPTKNYEETPLADAPSSEYITPAVVTPTELLPNYIITSEVNNPFMFKAEGYNKIGTGKVLGMATQTQALSQGQFGQYPLLVFSSEGIWAMSVNSSGLFSSVRPMSREVCSNPDSITMTDNAVFFASAKGLMMINGAQVTYVSVQMNGKQTPPFADIIANSEIAYDYRDSMLWLLNSDNHYYVFNIKSGTFAMTDFKAVHAVNDYPDTLLQDDKGRVFSLMNRPDINNDETKINAVMQSRPMKLEAGLSLKSIAQIKHIATFPGAPFRVGTDAAHMTLSVSVSNDMIKWTHLSSLRSKPWKYFLFTYRFYNLLPTDAFAGSVILTEERRTNKLR